MKRYKVTQIMNTKQLGLMLVAGLLSFGASAQVDLNVVPPAKAATVMLANENEIDSKDGTDVEGAAYNVMGEAGFIIPTGETYYARIDLGGGATFGSTVADNFDTLAGTQGNINTVGRASGGMGDSDVILSLPGPTADDTGWLLDNMTYTLKTKSTVSFTYRLYESASAAVGGGDNHLNMQSENLITFANATTMAGAASKSSLIDVEASSKLYENGTDTTHIMKVNIKNAMGVQRGLGDSGDVTLDLVVDKITLTATGDFTAVQAITDADDKVVTAAGKVWLDRDADCTPSHAAVVDDDDTDVDETFAGRNDNLGLAKINEAGLEAVVTLTNAENGVDDDNLPTGVFGDIADAFLCMETNGASEIPEGSYRGELSMTAADDYEAIDDVDFKGSTLAKNSETADLDFLLSPNGVFSNYVRLTNTSHVQGSNLRVTLINDEGDSVSFDLSDVDDVSSDLAPGASTKLININALYAAAQAVDRGEDADEEPIAMFTVTGGMYGNKLRAEFEGSVLAGHLKAQALSVSTDNTTCSSHSDLINSLTKKSSLRAAFFYACNKRTLY